MAKFCVAFATIVVFLPAVQLPVCAQPVTSFDFWSSDRDRTAEARIQTALARRMDFDFVEVPLKRFVELLNQQGVPAQVDHRALDDIGLDDKTPVRLQHSGITLRSALELVLHQLELGWTIRSEVLLISTDEELESQLKTRLYDISDLVPNRAYTNPWGFAASGRDFDSLIDLIQSTIEPQTWDVVGGPGAMDAYELNNSAVLVVSQTLPIHEQIARLLAGLLRVDQRHRRDSLSRTPSIRRSAGLPRTGTDYTSTIPRSSLLRSYLPGMGR